MIDATYYPYNKDRYEEIYDERVNNHPVSEVFNYTQKDKIYVIL